jgi:nucleoside-diphosphate-sugar epimerase
VSASAVTPPLKGSIHGGAASLRTLGDKVVITGAGGFVGQRLRLALPGARLLDRKTHRLDAPASLAELVRGAEVVVHLAGENAGSGYAPPLERLLRSNVLSTAGLLEALQESGVRAPVVVLLSTIHVYGRRDNYAEGTPTTPVSFYGFTKLAQEVLLREAAERGAIRALVLRASNIYGPGCRPYYNSAVATFCDRIRRGETIELMGSGRSQADLVYVDDVVRVIERSLSLSTAPVEVYNTSSGTSVEMARVVEVLGRVAGVTPKVRLTDDPPQVFTVPNDRLRAAMPELAFTPLEDGLRESYAASAAIHAERPA